MDPNDRQHRAILQRIARRAMLERGLLPDFSAQALAELGKIQGPARMNGRPVRDLTNLLWASIDNDDSRDLDQLTVAEAMPGDKVKVWMSATGLAYNWYRWMSSGDISTCDKSAHQDNDRMLTAIVQQRNLVPTNDLRIQRHLLDAAINARWIVHPNLKSRCADAVRHPIVLPMLGNARVDLQGLPHSADSQDGFESHAIHPAGGTTVPRPTAVPNVRRRAVDIRRDDIRLHRVPRDLSRRIAVVNWIEQMEHCFGAIALPQFGKCPHCPQRPMRVLSAILANAGRVSLDVTWVARGLIKRRREEQQELIVRTHETVGD